MNNFEWAEELNVAVTVCDTQGIVVYMNSKAAKTFSKDGGKELIGKSLMDVIRKNRRLRLLS